MKKIFILISLLIALLSVNALAEQSPTSDLFKTSTGDLRIFFIGHGSLMFIFNDKVIHVDPTNMIADYSKLPKADMVFITHDHPDHFDLKALAQITTPLTPIITTPTVGSKVKNPIVIKNGDAIKVERLKVEAVPAYNIVHVRSPGKPFHPKGVGNGYVITFGDKRVYIAGWKNRYLQNS